MESKTNPQPTFAFDFASKNAGVSATRDGVLRQAGALQVGPSKSRITASFKPRATRFATLKS